MTELALEGVDVLLLVAYVVSYRRRKGCIVVCSPGRELARKSPDGEVIRPVVPC